MKDLRYKPVVFVMRCIVPWTVQKAVRGQFGKKGAATSLECRRFAERVVEAAFRQVAEQYWTDKEIPREAIRRIPSLSKHDTAEVVRDLRDLRADRGPAALPDDGPEEGRGPDGE